jgi:hypothetical protein
MNCLHQSKSLRRVAEGEGDINLLAPDVTLEIIAKETKVRGNDLSNLQF